MLVLKGILSCVIFLINMYLILIPPDVIRKKNTYIYEKIEFF